METRIERVGGLQAMDGTLLSELQRLNKNLEELMEVLLDFRKMAARLLGWKVVKK